MPKEFALLNDRQPRAFGPDKVSHILYTTRTSSHILGQDRLPSALLCHQSHLLQSSRNIRAWKERSCNTWQFLGWRMNHYEPLGSCSRQKNSHKASRCPSNHKRPKVSQPLNCAEHRLGAVRVPPTVRQGTEIIFLQNRNQKESSWNVTAKALHLS